FKKLNDSHGHDVGDLALKNIAALLHGSLRTEDVVCRIGGEEFLVICTNTEAKVAAQTCAERMRKVVEYHTVKAANFEGKVTISIGVAGRDKDVTNTDMLLKLADTAVYDAKRAGRNRVCVAK
ncbi:MAG: GGDEF domain-containing protein, partial [Burkholderiales bacterium]